MNLSKQHQLYVGILGVAAIGLIADRTILKPSEAVASTDEYLVDGTEEIDEIAAADNAQGTAISLAKRLHAFGKDRQIDPKSVNDVFEPAWRTKEVAAETRDAKDPGQVATVAFVQTHRLTAVMGAGQSNGSGYAVVDGTLLRAGQMLDGWKLTSVASRSAVFESNGLRAELLVQIESTATSAAPPAETDAAKDPGPASPDQSAPASENLAGTGNQPSN